MHAKQYGVNKTNGFANTFFSNDWIHCVFTNKNASARQQKFAKHAIFSQMMLSTISILYFTTQQDPALTLVSIGALLYSVNSFSNSQKEKCTSYLQSYFTKTAKAALLISLALTTGSILMALLATTFSIDAIYGLYILQYVYRKNINHQTNDNLIEQNESGEKVEIQETVKENKKVNKLFRKGWKQNMCNVEGQVQKQICATMVIFLQLYTCVLGVIYQGQHLSFYLVVLTYATICLFSFINLEIVQDVEIIQLNITTIALSVLAIISLNQEMSLTLLVLTVALLGDSYCALRFKEDSHKIKFSPIEEFARQSWTQSAFQGDNMTLQIVACVFMFSQMSMSIIGSIYGQSICAIVLGFYLMRLIQFFGKVNLGVQMLQSNVACVALAIVAINYTKMESIVAVMSAAMIIADAILGTAIFFTQNEDEIIKQFAFIKKLGLQRKAEQTISIGINLGGKVVQLGMGKQNGESEYFQKV